MCLRQKVPFLLIFGVILFGTPSIALSEYEPTSTEAPEWYTQTSDEGLSINAVGSDTVTGFMNAVGALARQLDPNVNRMSEGYGEQSQENLVRVLAETSFDSVSVHSMSQHYRYQSRDAYSGESDLRRLVRITFPLEGDTTCEYKSYLQEIQNDISNSFTANPDPKVCTPKKLENTLARQGIQIVRSEPRLVRHYVQIRMQSKPVKSTNNQSPKDSSSRMKLKNRSLQENKEAMEEDMEQNLDELRQNRINSEKESDTEEKSSSSDTN